MIAVPVRTNLLINFRSCPQLCEIVNGNVYFINDSSILVRRQEMQLYVKGRGQRAKRESEVKEIDRSQC